MTASKEGLELLLYLGDGALVEPYAALRAELAARHYEGVEVGPKERWTRLRQDGLEADAAWGPEAFEGAVSPLAKVLSERWPTVALRAQGEVLQILLFRDGVVADRYANHPAPGARFGEGERRPYLGSPPVWADLLGTPRNAGRLERIWGSSWERETVLGAMAEVIGWRLGAWTEPT